MNDTEFAQSIAQWGSDVLRFCYVITGNRQDGEELYQDTMLLLLEKHGQLELLENPKAYAVSSAIKLWKNRCRKRFRRFCLVPQDSLDELTELGINCEDTTQLTPEEMMIRKMQVSILRKAIANLPEKYRVPLQLFYSADLPIHSVAQILRLPENTVKSRLHRAKEIIRKELEDSEYDRSGI